MLKRIKMCDNIYYSAFANRTTFYSKYEEHINQAVATFTFFFAYYALSLISDDVKLQELEPRKGFKQPPVV